MRYGGNWYGPHGAYVRELEEQLHKRPPSGPVNENADPYISREDEEWAEEVPEDWADIYGLDDYDSRLVTEL